MSTRVLVVDDDPDSREALGLVFSGDSATCELVGSAADALEVLAQGAFDVVVCDVRMEGMNGLELLDRVRRTQPALPFVMISGAGKVHDAVDAMKRGAFEYVMKPFDADKLRTAVGGAIGERLRLLGADDNKRASGPPPALGNCEIIGPGRAMRALQASIDQVADSSAPVLITGETGVGKELVARAIHARSDRRSHAFVAVNTSAVQDDLFESEVFGHVRGAFTGAAQSRKGLLTEADGGTLLLDEIGDMPASMQSKLLRVLQFGEVRPVGSDKVHFVDVRILAATHRDLPALVREGRFREDLYFRLNVLPIFVPALRDRREDIPALVAHFLGEARRRAPRSPVRSVSDEAMRMLADGHWAGNIRELASAIERAVVFSNDESLGPQHFKAIAPSESPELPPWGGVSHDPPWTLKHLNDTYTMWVLGQTDGDKHRAAEILGIDLSTLYRWQRAHDGPKSST
jgi:two-component system, NtrC family, response regulator HydG